MIRASKTVLMHLVYNAEMHCHRCKMQLHVYVHVIGSLLGKNFDRPRRLTSWHGADSR